MTDALPPGPRAPALAQTIAWGRDPIGYVERARKKYGPIWTSRLVGFPPLVHLSDPEAIQEVWKGDPSKMLAGEANRVLEPVLGARSLFLLDGAAHLAERRLLAPPFHAGAVASYARIFREATEERIASWQTDGTISLFDETQAITLDVVLEAVLGLREGEARRALRRDLAALLDGATHPVMLFRALQRELGGLSPWGRLMRHARAIDARLMALVDERRARPSDAHDLLSLLAHVVDEDGARLPPKAVRDELVTIVVAGHDTVASGLAWALHHLSLSPEVVARVQSELDSHADPRRSARAHGLLVEGPDGSGPSARADVGRSARAHGPRTGVPVEGPDGSGPSERADDLETAALPYLDAVVKEALRLSPVLPIVARRVTEDVRIGRVTIPRGARAAPNAWLSHREPDAWPDPERFSPERFLGRAPSASTYFPFGGGVRRCIGASFALAEMRVVLATILSRLTPVPVPGPAIVPERRGVTLVPSRGMPITFRAR